MRGSYILANKKIMETNEGVKKGTVIAIVVVLGLIVVSTWGWVRYSNRMTDQKEQIRNEDTEVVPDITAKHQYKNGKHIIAGEVNLPTPCYILDVQAVVAESMPEQVTLKFTSTTQGELCAQMVTTERFRADFTASQKAVISATWNGKPVKLNLIPAGVNEDLNNFEIFIKG